jgi:hypothetical protein
MSTASRWRHARRNTLKKAMAFVRSQRTADGARWSESYPFYNRSATGRISRSLPLVFLGGVVAVVGAAPGQSREPGLFGGRRDRVTCSSPRISI